MTNTPDNTRQLDEQERLVVRELIRNPRESDNGIGELTGVNVRTVNRKRHRLEEAGVLSYYTCVDLADTGTGQFTARHMYVIKFRLGITIEQITTDIKKEAAVRSVFTELIFESHIAEVDGALALVLMVDGKNDSDIVEKVQSQLIPALLSNHGEKSIEEISTMRLLKPIRRMRNYIPFLNMENGFIREEWPNDAVYVGE